MSKSEKWLALLITFICILLTQNAFPQSGREYRRSAVMRGNLVKTVFGNWGVIGQPETAGE